MAGYIKELLHDVFDEKCDIHTRVDLIGTITALYRSGQLTFDQILCLWYYYSGYSVNELNLRFPAAKELLIAALGLIEDKSGYKDEQFLNSAFKKYPKYIANARAYQRRIIRYGRIFE